jgi:hypothetical protein
MFEQQFHHLDSVLLAGNMEWGKAVKSSRIWVSFAI